MSDDRPQRFHDRQEAGRRLAERLAEYGGKARTVILALPRGGVPVGFPLAQALDADLDVIPVRKLGTPGHAELAMGALAEGGQRTLNQRLIDSASVEADAIEQTVEREQRELERQASLFRGDREPAAVEGRTAILVDDGLATGASMEAAVGAVRQRRPKTLIVAVPVAAPDAVDRLKQEADEVVALMTPTTFTAVGQWYEDFSQVSDEQVRDLLDRRNRQVEA